MNQLAVAIAAAEAPPSALVVWRGFEASMDKAARLDYDGVELALRDAGEIDAAQTARQLADRGLACPCISTGQVFAVSGLHFTAANPARRRHVVAVFRDLVDLAAELGAMLNIGRVRGFVADGQTVDDARARFIDVAVELATYARTKGVTLILEPVNRYEINFINSLAEAADLLDATGAANMALMPDVFHMNIEDHTIGGELERFGPRIAYIHLADSNRLAPGWGHLDFDEVFASLRRIGFDGWASVEILPRPDPDAAAAQAIAHLRPYLAERGAS
ncbi:MAG: TIM barrel protein [Planctomycetota bacterium]